MGRRGNPDAPTEAAFNAAQWKSQIDNYGLPAPEQGTQNGVELLSADSKRMLLEGVVKSTEAREKFLDYLAIVHSDISKKANGINKETVKMETLLGPKGLALYHAAIREEAASQAFREAVFNVSTKKYEGPKWAKRLVLWVGGPSASGKTAASERAVRMMGEQVMTSSDPANTEGNYVVSIDGGVEREMSQMRQMVLQVALSKGFKGIEDLHSNTKLKIKSKVKKAVLADGKLNVVIPETFASSLASGVRKSKMKKFEKDDNTIQIFTEVRADKDKKRFKRTVRSMGESRAWYQGDKFPAANIAMNNRRIGCESKVYEPENFKWGKLASRMARRAFFEISKNGLYFKIAHDLMYVTKGANKEWRECTADDKDVPTVLISEKNFEIWKLLKKNKLTKRDLNELKKYPGFDENMNLETWARFCYKHAINPSAITREKAGVQMLQLKARETLPSTGDASSHRPPPITVSHRPEPGDKDLRSQISEVSLKQTHSSIETLSDYLKSKKTEHHIVNCVEKTSSQGIPTSLEITFKNEATNSEPKVVAQNAETQNAVNFSTKRGMPDEDFAFVAQETAKMAVAMAEPGTVFDLSSTPKAKLAILENALLKAIDDAVKANPTRFSETSKPSVQGGTRPPESTNRRPPS